MAQKIRKGLFITFEGPEGCGKSTQSRRLSEDLSAQGLDVVYTAEPGGTGLGECIREIILKKDTVRMDNKAELFLFEADRAQHVKEIILPALDAGKIVICDRFNTATFAYQGYGLGIDLGSIKRMDDISTAGTTPDLVVLMDIDVKAGLERAGSSGNADRMEKRNTEFHEKVRRGYLALAKRSKGKIKVIEVKEDIDGTYEKVKDVVRGVIEGYKRAG
ncbi:MAG: dTMP kinase [Candidatus Omnitrophota bacterium]|nr:dTMP kinase [Candidatus Omnitrophota bacterium]